MRAWDPWTYRVPHVCAPAGGRNLASYDVEATNGRLGTVNEATYTPGSCYLVVDTGPWVFGARFMMIPAGTIERIDAGRARVYLDLATDQVKDAPPFDAVAPASIQYRRGLAEYYGRFYGGSGRRDRGAESRPSAGALSAAAARHATERGVSAVVHGVTRSLVIAARATID